MNVLDLFSGIGGFSLGLERAGMRTVAFCEIDPYCRKVLAKHWPDVPIFGDIRNLSGKIIADAIGEFVWEQSGRRDGSSGANSSQPRFNGSQGIDLICGGFPCQDISVAGKGAGIEGNRSGLWSEYARIIGEVRPRYVIVENVAALLGRGLERVLGDLAALGYDAEWHCIPASAVGAPHRRDRVWIVAHASCAERGQINSACGSTEWLCSLPQRKKGSGGLESGGEDVADPNKPRLSPRSNAGSNRQNAPIVKARFGPYLSCSLSHTEDDAQDSQGTGWPESARFWRVEPDVGRVAHGVSARVDRLKSLGNAVVPQIPEIIGRAIIKAESLTCR